VASAAVAGGVVGVTAIGKGAPEPIKIRGIHDHAAAFNLRCENRGLVWTPAREQCMCGMSNVARKAWLCPSCRTLG